MGIDRENRELAYCTGRLIAIAEHYAGKRFGQFTLDNLFTHPQYNFGVWRRYIDQSDEFFMELGDIVLPVTMGTSAELGRMWVGYYHQKAAYSDNTEERLRIGRRIADLRKENGLTQAQLAERCGLQQAHIARIELGKYSVGLDTLAQIAAAMGMTVDFVRT